MLGELSLLEWGVLGVEVCKLLVGFGLKRKFGFHSGEGILSEVVRLMGWK